MSRRLWRDAPVSEARVRVTQRAIESPHTMLSECLSSREALVAVGGVTLGGLAKTEVSLWLLNARLKRVRSLRETGEWHLREGSALLAHAYCGTARRSPRVERVEVEPYHQLSEAERQEALSLWGDEALMSRWRLPAEVEVWAGGTWAARAEAAHLAGAAFVVADGGFYHSAMPTTHPLCLFNPRLPARLWPLGHLSRPLSAFPQALWWAHDDTQAHVTQAHVTQAQANTQEGLSVYEPCAPLIAWSRYTPDELIDPEGRPAPLSLLRGVRVQLWVGVARPERVKEALEGLGAEVYEHVRTLNHRGFPSPPPHLKPHALRVCTHKDLARVPRGVEVYTLRVSLEVRCA